MKCDVILKNTFKIDKWNYQPFSFQVSLERKISKANYSRSTERKEESQRSNIVGGFVFLYMVLLHFTLLRSY